MPLTVALTFFIIFGLLRSAIEVMGKIATAIVGHSHFLKVLVEEVVALRNRVSAVEEKMDGLSTNT